jgi:hypothetical protein
MTGDWLSAAEDIDIAARTYGAVMMADDVGTDLVDPDEWMTLAVNLIESFFGRPHQDLAHRPWLTFCAFVSPFFSVMIQTRLGFMFRNLS